LQFFKCPSYCRSTSIQRRGKPDAISTVSNNNNNNMWIGHAASSSPHSAASSSDTVKLEDQSMEVHKTGYQMEAIMNCASVGMCSVDEMEGMMRGTFCHCVYV
jgi:hypothetical protein